MVTSNPSAWFLLGAVLFIAGCPGAGPDDEGGCPGDRPAGEPCPPVDSTDAPSNSFTLSKGAIIAPHIDTAFLLAPEGGMDAVDLRDGRRKWHSDLAAKPLLARGNFVVAQAEYPHALRISVLDTARNGEPLLSIDADLPSGVQASVVDGLESTFESRGLWVDESLYVMWTYTEHSAGGMDPGTNGGERTVSGAVRVDLATGAVSSTGLADVPQEEEPPLPDNVRDLVESGAVAGPLWRVDGQLAALDTATDATVLRRWRADSGDALASITLFGPPRMFRGISADERHLLVSAAADGSNGMWTWSIFALDTGAPSPAVTTPLAGAAFFVSGDILYYESPANERLEGENPIEEPIKLHAVSLASGAQLWEYARRDTAYRGSFPPGVP